MLMLKPGTLVRFCRPKKPLQGAEQAVLGMPDCPAFGDTALIEGLAAAPPANCYQLIPLAGTGTSHNQWHHSYFSPRSCWRVVKEPD